MKTTVSTTILNVSALDVVKSFFKTLILFLLFAVQSLSRCADIAKRCASMVRNWLKSRHNFTDPDEPVFMTGWQFLGFSLLVILGSFLLSLEC